MEKKLYRSTIDKKIAGVCAGIADYLEVDPTLVRIIWVCFSLCYGTGVILYIACAALMPVKDEIDQ
ncbi:MAG: PspC domain-containing protein [Erysipelotrichaceae bacterium]|nr:PspC domain-containing protein [Erysipelotrichaceae bacterium]